MGDTMNNLKLSLFALPLTILSASLYADMVLEEVVVTAHKKLNHHFKIHLLQLPQLLREQSKT